MSTKQPEMATYEVPLEMRDFAEKSVNQAHKAVDSFFGAAQKAVDTFEGSQQTLQGNVKDITRKTFAYAEQNIAAHFDFARKIVNVKDVHDMMNVLADFTNGQLSVMQNQMKEFSQFMQKNAAKSESKALSSSSAQSRKHA